MFCLKIQFWCEYLLFISIEYQSKSFSEFREQLRKQSVDEVKDEIAKSGKGKKRSKSVAAVQGDSGSDNALNLEEFRKFFKILLKMEEIEKLFYKCALCLRSPTRTVLSTSFLVKTTIFCAVRSVHVFVLPDYAVR